MRSTCAWGRLIAGPLVLAALAMPQAAAAQSFFQGLFGGSTAAMPAPAYRPRVIPPSSLGGFGQQRIPAMSYRSGDGERSHAGRSGEHKGGGYRTVCVRACDGYYWPISANVSRSRFHRDAAICRSSCGSEAKLFYQGAGAGDAKSLVDLQGRPYARLDTAFLYRKTLVEGCACREQPWSEAELIRHQQYAIAAGMVPTSSAPWGPQAAEVVAGNPAPDDAAGEASAAKAVASAEAAAPAVAPPKPAEAQQRPRHEAVAAGQAPRGKASGSKPARGHSAQASARHAGAPRTQPKPKPLQQAAKAPPKPKATQSASLIGGQAKYAWPGDPPTRYR